MSEIKNIDNLLQVSRNMLEEAEREFRVERYCFLGSTDDWIDLGGSDQLETLLKKYVKHLGRESFYHLR